MPLVRAPLSVYEFVCVVVQQTRENSRVYKDRFVVFIG